MEKPASGRASYVSNRHLRELLAQQFAGERSRVAFAPGRPVLLPGGDKAGNWQQWCRENIPLVEQLYPEYTTDQQE